MIAFAIFPGRDSFMGSFFYYFLKPGGNGRGKIAKYHTEVCLTNIFGSKAVCPDVKINIV
jgi:hypothetical protein